MNPIWIGIGVCIAVAILGLLIWLRRAREADLGTVSHQWIMENRLGPGNDSRR